MRVLPMFASLVALVMVGCARQQMMAPAAKPSVEATRNRPVPMPPVQSLAFTPAAARDVADDLDLSRDGRGMFADAGFESTVISESFVRQDDRMRMSRFGDDGTFERRAVSTTVTIRQR